MDNKKEKKVKCVFCNQPIHIDDFVGIVKEGLICGKPACLAKLANMVKNKEGNKNDNPK